MAPRLMIDCVDQSRVEFMMRGILLDRRDEFRVNPDGLLLFFPPFSASVFDKKRLILIKFLPNRSLRTPSLTETLESFRCI